MGVIHQHRNQPQHTIEDRYADDSSIPLALLLEGHRQPLRVVVPACAGLKSDMPVRVRKSLLTVSLWVSTLSYVVLCYRYCVLVCTRKRQLLISFRSVNCDYSY